MSNAIFPSAIKGLMLKVVKTPEFSTVIQPAADPMIETRIVQAQNPRWHWQLAYDQLFNDLSNSAYTSSELETLMGFVLARQGSFDSFLFDDPEDDSVTIQVLQLIADTTNPVSAAVIGGSAGTGFAVGDLLAVTGGGGSGAVLRVATRSGTAIATFTIVSGGSGYSTTSGAALTVLTGSGSGSPTANITAVSVYYTPLQRNLGEQFFEDITDLNLQGDAHAFPISGTHNKIFANAVQKSQSYSGNTGDFDLLGPGLALPGFSSAGLYLKWHAQPTGPITGTFMYYFRVRFEKDTQDFSRFLYRLWTIGGEEESSGEGVVRLVSARDVT